MKKWMKITLGVIGGVVALIGVALTGLLMFFDPNDYKSQIDAAIERQIGRQVTIDGDIHLSVFPWLGVELGRVTVANAPGFGDRPLAAMDSAEVSVRVLPLFAKHLEIGTVGLNGLDLRLTRRADGKTNWKDIVEHLSADQNTTDDTPPEPQPSTTGGFEMSSLQVGAVEIQDAAIGWRDAVAGTDYRLRGVHIETGRLSDGEPFRLELGGDLAAREQGLSAKLNAVTQIEPNIADRFFRFANLSANVLASGPAVPGKKQQANVSASGDLDWGAGRFKLDRLALQAAGLNVTGNVDGTGLHDRLAYSGRITVQEFDPRAVLGQLELTPPATRNEDALSDASFDAQFNGGADSVDFKQIVAKLDDSTLEGTARIKRFAAPRFGFDLDLDTLNLDDYMPPDDGANTSKSQGAETKDSAANQRTEIDLSPLEGLYLDGTLTAASLIADNVHVSDAKLVVHAADGVLTLDPLTAALYGGRLRMSGRIDSQATQPRYHVKGDLEKVHIAPLLHDVVGSDRVSAKGGLTLDLSASGRRVDAIEKTLTGNAGFDLTDGAFHGFDLTRIVAAARKQIENKGSIPENIGLSPDAKTSFRNFTGRFKVDEGVMDAKRVDLQTNDIRARGSGRYDIARNALDYTINAEVGDDAPGKLSELSGITVPLKLTGSLFSPSYTIDVSRLVQNVAGSRLQKEKSKVQDKVRDKLRDTLGQGADSDTGKKIQQGLSNLLGGGEKKNKNGKEDTH